MSKIILFCLASFSSLQLFSQENEMDKRLNTIRYEDARRQKKNGILLTALGGTLTGVGLIVGLNSSVTTTSTSGGATQTSTTGNPQLASSTLLLGMVGLGIGIPVWSVNAHREKKWRNSDRISLSVTPHINGMSLHLRF